MVRVMAALAAVEGDGADERILAEDADQAKPEATPALFLVPLPIQVPKAIAASEMPTFVPYACITSNALSPQMSSSLKNVTSIFASFDPVICGFMAAFYALYRTIYHILYPLASYL